MRTSSSLTTLALCVACLLAGAPAAAQDGTPFTATYTFDTAGPTACGTNENAAAQVEPQEYAASSDFERSGVVCADDVDDAFSSSGFNGTLEQARSMQFRPYNPFIQGIEFQNNELRVRASKSASGPTEMRLGYILYPGRTFVELTRVTLATDPQLYVVAVSGIRPSDIIFTVEARYTPGVPVDPEGVLSLHEVVLTGKSLPVEITSFEAHADDDGILLRWTTASETNNAGFHVEHRAADAGAWSEVAFLSGHGTTAEAWRYERRVGGLAPGGHRFRLRQVDFDGTAAYSNEVEAVVAPPGGLALSAPQPNPGVRAALVLTSDRARRVTVAVYDALGRRVAVAFEGALGAGESRALVLNARAWGLAPGAYAVRAEGGGATASRTFVAR